MSSARDTVTMLLPQALSAYSGGRRELDIDCPVTVTLGSILDRLAQSDPALERRIRDETGQIRRFVNVYVGDDECRTVEGLLTKVAPGSTILVVGSVAGG